MASKCLKILKISYECKPESRTPRETGGGGKRRAGPEIEKETRRKQGFVWWLGYLSDASPQRQEMVLLHTGNELMAKIRPDNGWGNQKSMPMQQRGEWERIKGILWKSFWVSDTPVAYNLFVWCTSAALIKHPSLYFNRFGEVCIHTITTWSGRFQRFICYYQLFNLDFSPHIDFTHS